MHPGRRSILVRWIAYIVVVAGTAAWLYTNQQMVSVPASTVMERLSPKKIDLPPDEVTETIREAISAVSHKAPSYGAVEKIDPALVVLDPQVLKDDDVIFEPLFISALFLGPPHKYTIINGVVYEQGDALPDGRVVKEITDEGVTVAFEGSSEKVAWLPPYRVELKAPVKEAADLEEEEALVPTEETAATETETPTAEQGDLTSDQALQILQQLGRQ